VHALALGTAAAAAVIVFRGGLAYFFSQDDFGGLARAAGLLPRLDGPWRYLSGQAYFDLMRAVAGLDPLPYHAVSLIAHLACTVLVWLLLARWVSAPAAWLGTMFFAVHPAHFTALYSISGIGEILSAGFGLGALIAIAAPGPARWLAVPLFAFSLVSKESTVFLPLVAAAIGREGRARSSPAPARRWMASLTDPVILALSALSILYIVSFVARDAFGIRHPLPDHAPYALAFDHSLGANLLTYLGWTANFLVPTVRSFMDVVDPGVFAPGTILALLWLAGTLLGDLRKRGWLIAGALYLAPLLPVLPLRNHTYHYYLYGPLIGAAWCLGAIADTLWARLSKPRTARTRSRARARTEPPTVAPRSPRAAWVMVAVLAAALTWNGALLVRKIETYPFLLPELRADPIVDRARIAANVHADLRSSALPARLLFWSPASIELQRSVGRNPESESYFEANVRSALMDGLAVRVLFPQVREVSFVRGFRPVDSSVNYALYGPDGHVRLMSRAEQDSLGGFVDP
jgi:hypothetical protein